MNHTVEISIQSSDAWRGKWSPYLLREITHAHRIPVKLVRNTFKQRPCSLSLPVWIEVLIIIVCITETLSLIPSVAHLHLGSNDPSLLFQIYGQACVSRIAKTSLNK